ncbi:MAG TPA: peptidoglycan-binding domain-containing protein [Azospirillum sp.]|nr:peptidoglycan-binding domain-containing protein [Azospirillum sp.]
MFRLKEAAVSASLLLALAACGSTDTSRTATGAGSGAVAGAVVGGPVGAVVGGVGGGAAGYSMNESLGTKTDRATDRVTDRAAEAVNRDTGRQGTAGRTPSMSPERVRNVQQALNDNGSQIAVDGRWGPETQKALEDFQRSRDLKPTGRLDAETRAALNLDQQPAGAGNSGNQ